MSITLADIYRKPEKKLPTSIGVGDVVQVHGNRWMLARVGKVQVQFVSLGHPRHWWNYAREVADLECLTRDEVQALLSTATYAFGDLNYVGRAKDVIQINPYEA